MNTGNCKFGACKRRVQDAGWCVMHLGGVARKQPRDEWGRFFFRVILYPSGCWFWAGTKNAAGYGGFRGTTAHRWAYRQFIGDFDPILEIDHLCRNTSCVNPEHLEAVTGQENLARGEGASAVNARKTHCAQGHPFSGENLYYEKSSEGKVFRRCRTCSRVSAMKQFKKWRERTPLKDRRGENHRGAILTAAQVLEIRELRKTTPLRTLAALYGVSESCVGNVASRRTWQHI